MLVLFCAIHFVKYVRIVVLNNSCKLHRYQHIFYSVTTKNFLNKQKVMGKWGLSGRKLLGRESAKRSEGWLEEEAKALTIPSTTNVYSTPSATKGRNYCLLEKLYFATLNACRDNSLPNLKMYYLTRRWKSMNMPTKLIISHITNTPLMKLKI